MPRQNFPESFLALLRAVKGKRARIVVEHILEHGSITTEEIEQQYGYKHPPRAVRDVREQGIPLITFNVKNAAGQTIAAYRFGDLEEVEKGKIGGRRVLTKELRDTLYEQAEGKCAICLTQYEARYLQIDHRIPYLVAEEGQSEDTAEYVLLCGSCNRAKSWSCEHCENGQETKAVEVCQNCYWANPVNYTHIALRPICRVDVVWSGEDVADFDQLKQRAASEDESLPDYIKAVLARHLWQDNP